MRIFFRPEARAEVLEAQTWYESCAGGLGLEFARVVDAAVSSEARNPEAFFTWLATAAVSCFGSFLSRWYFRLAEMSF